MIFFLIVVLLPHPLPKYVTGWQVPGISQKCYTANQQQDKVLPVLTTKAYMGSRGMAPRFLYPGTKWR